MKRPGGQAPGLSPGAACRARRSMAWPRLKERRAARCLQRPPHRAEALAVLRRRQRDLAPEQAAEEAGVLVADLVGDRLDRRVARFEHLLRLLQPQRVHVLERRHAGGLLEAPLERALRQSREPHHRRHRRRLGVVVGDPRLAARDHGVLDWRERASRANGCWPIVVPVDQVDARRLHRDFDAGEARDQVQRQVEPRRAAARHHQPLALAGDDQRALRVHADRADSARASRRSRPSAWSRRGRRAGRVCASSIAPEQAVAIVAPAAWQRAQPRDLGGEARRAARPAAPRVRARRRRPAPRSRRASARA